MPPAISIENLGKRYVVDHETQRGYRTLRESLVNLASAPLRRLRGHRSATRKEFWALKDVSFEVQPGEVVGIIGRNGAGKSTLLKVLSQITKPTCGRVRLNGRVGSLLEVGTGFHPELTGHENIYLNGSILGMTRREIDRKFDEIVDFSGVEAFLDMPVKRYSSGMYVRLAFAVAAHLEPEILLVDEVLAVGDHAFHTKSIEKMRSVARAGRTVIVVSHNLSIVSDLCERGIILDAGCLGYDGLGTDAIDRYLHDISAISQIPLAERLDRRGAGTQTIERIDISHNNDSGDAALLTGGPCIFTFHLRRRVEHCTIEFSVYDSRGYPVASFNSAVGGPDDIALNVETCQIHCKVESLWLVPGKYRINAAMRHHAQLCDHIEGAATFEIADSWVNGRPVSAPLRWGTAFLPHNWHYVA